MLKTSRSTHIPDNYSDALAELKGRSFRWETNFCSRTDNKTIGHITHYSIDNTPAENCLVLIPGLASNTRSEPLMKVIEYWALMNKHDVYCLDTFLGDFLPEVSQDLADKHTFAEFIDLIDMGMEIISRDVKDKKYAYSCVVGHSAGATGALEVFNKRIGERKKLRFSSSVLFAPYVAHEFTNYMKSFYKGYYFNNQISDEDFMKTVVGVNSPHEERLGNKYKKISILPAFYNDVASVEFRPDLMDRYSIPVTLVAAGRDRKSPPEELRKKYEVLHEGKNGNLWKFVVFQNSRHSFIDQHKDWNAILSLIRSQKRLAQRHMK